MTDANLQNIKRMLRDVIDAASSAINDTDRDTSDYDKCRDLERSAERLQEKVRLVSFEINDL